MNNISEQLKQMTDDAMKAEVQDGDVRIDSEMQIPRIRIYQNKNQTGVPDGAELGEYYSQNMGFIAPSKSLDISVASVINMCKLWPDWKDANKYVVCRCRNKKDGKGFPSIQNEEGKWVPGDVERNCSHCPHDWFRDDKTNPLPPLKANGKVLDGQCKGEKLISGFILSDGDLDPKTAIPFFMVVGSVMFTKQYRARIDSWTAFDGALKMMKPPMPWWAYRLRMSTVSIETTAGSVYAPIFEVIGSNPGIFNEIRNVIENEYSGRLALTGHTQDVHDILEELPEPAPSYEPEYTGQPGQQQDMMSDIPI